MLERLPFLARFFCRRGTLTSACMPLPLPGGEGVRRLLLREKVPPDLWSAGADEGISKRTLTFANNIMEAAAPWLRQAVAWM